MRRILVFTLVAALAAGAAPSAGPAAAQDGGEDAPAADAWDEAPIDVTAVVDDSRIRTTGVFTIRLTFRAERDIGRALSVSAEVAYGDRTVVSWDHTPDPPPVRWKKGQTVTCELSAPFPRDATDLEGCALDVLVGFRDATTGRTIPPRGSLGARGGRTEVGRLTGPKFDPVSSEEAVAQVLAAADELAAAGRKPEAWSVLEFALRGAPDDATKYRMRNAMAKLGDFAPAPLTEVERRIVDQRIADERERWLRQVAGRMWDQQKLHGALLLLEEVGGKLAEAADTAVVGALRDAKRVEKDLEDLRERIRERISPEDRDEAEKALKSLGRTKACLDRAREWVKAGRLPPARRVAKELAVAGSKDCAGDALALAKEIDRALLAAIPPAERTEAEAAMRHPAFARTKVSLSHEFVFIGPEKLVTTIPPGSRTAFDLAYVFVTDLFGRRPNPGGDRVTVYFKELWDFGGGVGGGKTIDIGNAKPDATGMPIDNALLFHELVHCVDDTRPIHAGFREGLADFGAAYTHEALGRSADALRAMDAAATAFRKDYVDRDLEYWRIPNYGPSAGFLLHFTRAWSKGPQGHDWSPWRRFFREYRAAPIRDGREPQVMRMFARHLVRAFGPRAFDDLVRFRFPLVAGDLAAVEKEAESYESGGPARDADEDFRGFPNSPLPRDLATGRALELLRTGGQDDEVRRIASEELGVVFDWRVCGPFEPHGTDPGAEVFPPEREFDFAKEYPQRMNIARWRTAGEPGPVQIDPLGWVKIEYGYMDDTATYAVTNLTAAAAADVRFHVRADDDFSLFVNGERLDDYGNRGWNDSTPVRWRGPVEKAPDAMVLAAKLRAGRNVVMLKIRNRGGAAGFVCAVAQPDGRPVPGLRADAGAPDAVKPVPEPKWRSVAKHDFRQKVPVTKFENGAGAWEVADRTLHGTTTTKGVAWRKYTVRPGFPRDSPSNLLWLRPDATDGLADFRLTLRLVPGAAAPKLAVTFQGEGGNDGLSGWNLLLWDSGGRIAGQVERYENLWYQWPAAERAVKFGGKPPDDAPGKTRERDRERGEDDTEDLVVTLVRSRLSVSLGGVTLLDSVPIRAIPGRTRIGFSTWGADPKIAGIELEAPKAQ